LRYRHHDAGVSIGRMLAGDAAVMGRKDSVAGLNFRRLLFQPTRLDGDGIHVAVIKKRDDFIDIRAVRKNGLREEGFGVFSQFCNFCQTDTKS
jgi:hypothetical protein